MAKEAKKFVPKAGSDKATALNAVIEHIEKNYGENAIMRLGDARYKKVDVISTGALSLDLALGIGGLPRGRIIEIYGPESSGKTTVCLHVIAEAQKLGGEAAFIDAEHALDPIYAKKLGVDIDKLLLAQPDSGEQALEILEALARSGALDIIVVDSVAALVPKAEIAGEMGESHVGAHARLMSQALRKLTSVISHSNAVVIFINQIREKVGVIYGSPEVTTGGRALKFFSSVRIDVRKGEPIKDGSKLIGNRTKVKVVKNKMAPPFMTAEFDMIFGQGISKSGNILDAAANFDIVKKSGAWYSYNGDRIGQGREKAKEFLEKNPHIMEEIRASIMNIVEEKHKSGEYGIPGMDADGDDAETNGGTSNEDN